MISDVRADRAGGTIHWYGEIADQSRLGCPAGPDGLARPAACSTDLGVAGRDPSRPPAVRIGAAPEPDACGGSGHVPLDGDAGLHTADRRGVPRSTYRGGDPGPLGTRTCSSARGGAEASR